MNFIKKIGCRAFQSVLNPVVAILPYRRPRILETVEAIPTVLIEKRISTVFIVTDKDIHKIGLLEGLKNALDAKEIKYYIYDDITPNPTIRNVEDARRLYKLHRCQALIGFGGGSAIDCAKAVGARLARPKKSIKAMNGILQVLLPIPFTVAVPTTAGTGSETTVTTVITDEATGHKFPISDPVLIPNVAVHDPEVLKSLPPSLTATTGMDALTHAIEAYIGNAATKATKRDALKAASLIAGHLEDAYENGNKLYARRCTLYAAFMAGRAFSKSYVGYCHAVAHSLGGKYHIPHGLANAVLLPYVLEAYGKSIYTKAKDIAVAMKIVEASENPAVATAKLIAKIREMNRNMGIPEKLPGIEVEDIPQLAKYADKEANPLYPVPKLMDAKELEQFYYAVLE